MLRGLMDLITGHAPLKARIEELEARVDRLEEEVRDLRAEVNKRVKVL